MPVTAKERRYCEALLDQGEQLRYVIPTLASGMGRAYSAFDYYLVVTDRRVLVIAGSMMRRGRPKEIELTYPRPTKLGPLTDLGGITPTVEMGGRFFEISEEYVAVVAAADAEIDGDALPDDPFPDL